MSTLNDTDGYTIANAAIVSAGTNAGIQMVAGYPTDVIADINGYFSLNASQGSYVNVTGARDIGSGPPGTPQQYTLHFTNTNADVVYGQVLFTTSSQPSGTYACQIEWNSAGNLNLISPNVNVDASFGQQTTLSDPSIPCSVDASRSTKTQTGSGYDISLWITFASGFNGSSVQAFAYGENSQGLASLWLPTSSWVIGSWYYLNTQASPLGEGTDSPTPGWYSSGAQVTVTATPNQGYSFNNFTGDLTGAAATQSLSMNGPKTVTANFALGASASQEMLDSGAAPNQAAGGCGPTATLPDCAVRSLGKIASSSYPDVQRCGALALASIHTRDTLPHLAELLYCTDAIARESAVQGLSRFVDNLPSVTAFNVPNGAVLQPQGPTLYRTPETDKYSLSRRSLGQTSDAEYVAFWKSWWTIMKVQLAADAP